MNWTLVYYAITKSIRSNQIQFDQAFEINQKNLIHDHISKNDKIISDLLSIKNVEVEPSLWELDIVYQKSNLLLAILNGKISIIRSLINKSPQSINYYVFRRVSDNRRIMSYFTTPLLYAISLSKLDIAIELINLGSDVNAKEHASNNIEEPDYYNSAISLLLTIDKNFQSPHFESLFVMLSQSCYSFEPGLLGMFKVQDQLHLAKIYIEKTRGILSKQDFEQVPKDLKTEYVKILKWLRIQELLIGTIDTHSILFLIPIELVVYISEFFFTISFDLFLPYQVISPFWFNLYKNFKDEFYFLNT